VQFNHDNMTGVLLAAELANLQTGDGWSAASLETILRDHEIRRPSVDRGAENALRRWALRLRSVFAAASVADRCQTINSLLVDGTANVYLTTHDDLRPHLHFASDDDDVVGRVMAVTAGGLAIFTLEAEGQRLGVCARSGCARAFVDTSRNGRRAYCTARCGNSDAVLRHRSRKTP
jgi:predicted RNA-binding Zn ribbon-like protein